MRKFGGVLLALLLFLAAQGQAGATTKLYFNPPAYEFVLGEVFTYQLLADIDLADEIIGFGFDLSFDGGNTYVSGPGATVQSLKFVSFVPNSTIFVYESLFDSDGDTISGIVDDIFAPPVSGVGILLGEFAFEALNVTTTENIYLGADDLGVYGLEGLIRDEVDSENIMPNNPEATAQPIPEPASLLLLGLGVGGLLARKTRGGN